jgi:hypothetical protein
MPKTIRSKVSTALSLPTETNTPPENLEDYCAMIYGRKQWGKSTLAAQYPGALNFMFEPGRYGLSILQVPNQGEPQLDWPTFREYIKLFCESSDYQIAVIDTVDRAYDRCFRYVCADLGIKHPDDRGRGGYAVWDVIKDEFESPFIEIKFVNKVFILTSHEKDREKGDRDGATWNQTIPSCKPAAWGVAQGMCDFVFHCDFIGGHRVITVRDLDNSSVASCNPEIECFLDPRGAPLRRFKIPNDRTKVFATVNSAFHNKLDDYDYSPPAKPLPAKKAVFAKNGTLMKGKSAFAQKLASRTK